MDNLTELTARTPAHEPDGIATRPRQRGPALQALDQAHRIMVKADTDYRSGELSREEFDDEVRRARKVITAAFKHPANSNQPALNLRYADLIRQDSRKSDNRKRHAVTHAISKMERALQYQTACVPFNAPPQIKTMIGLVAHCQQKGLPELALRLLDIVDYLDPHNQEHHESRQAMRAQCQPVMIPREHAPAPHRNAISPTVVPPAILKR